MNPTQNVRYRHRMVIEFETSNGPLDDFSRALEPWTPAAARRFAENEIRQNAGISDQSAFRVVEHGVVFLHTATRKILSVVKVRKCAQCGKRRTCFQYRHPGNRRMTMNGHRQPVWVCVRDCADDRYTAGWRPVVERVQ